MTERERFLAHWLIRAYHAMGRQGWEEGPSSEEIRTGLHNVLCNLDLDPHSSKEARAVVTEWSSISYSMPDGVK